jgi:hypothetical protein
MPPKLQYQTELDSCLLAMLLPCFSYVDAMDTDFEHYRQYQATITTTATTSVTILTQRLRPSRLVHTDPLVAHVESRRAGFVGVS